MLVFVVAVEDSQVESEGMMFAEGFLNDRLLLWLTIEVEELDVGGVLPHLVLDCCLTSLQLLLVSRKGTLLVLVGDL